MRWLGHHEFGVTHKTVRFSTDNGAPAGDNAMDVNYWLSTWTGSYRYLLDTASPDDIFISFEDLCEFPALALKPLFERGGLRLDTDRQNADFQRATAEKRQWRKRRSAQSGTGDLPEIAVASAGCASGKRSGIPQGVSAATAQSPARSMV
ncbi:MAG: hypothetical protein ABI648_15340 [Betaproteobacteria bacterium]